MRQLLSDVDVGEVFASLWALPFGFANLKGINLIVPGVRKSPGTPGEIAAHEAGILMHGLKS